ncbi:MAG: hypothetical protein OXB84_01575 [Halobacteriovoraceae bacterium]|nr:hypothetical protein [Halobacteriovoraceae bacterium]
MVNLTITGFQPFLDFPLNTSEEVVKHMASRSTSHGPFVVDTHVFPVVYRDSKKQLENVIRENRPDIFIITGVSRKTHTLCLESTAKNRDNSESPDNLGDVRLNRIIDPGGPSRYVSELPLSRFKDHLAKAGVSASLSDDAGGFICNHYYYTTYLIKESLGRPRICLFVHLPDLPVLENIEKLSIKSLADSLLFLARMIHDYCFIRDKI